MAVYGVTGVDDTGATDATAAILAFIATVPNGTAGSPNVVQFASGKTFRVDGTLALTSRSYLTINGGGSTFTTSVEGSRSRAFWRLIDTSGIRLTNGVFVGPNTAAGLGDLAYSGLLEGQHAFELGHALDTTIDNWTTSQIWGDHIYLTRTTLSTSSWTDGVLVENCSFVNNGRQVLSIIACRNVEIRNCSTVTARRSIIDIEPNGVHDGCDNIYIHHNTFGQQRLNFVSSKGYAGVCDNVRIEYNALTGPMSVSIDPPGLNLRHNWTVKGNVSSGLAGSSSAAVVGFRYTDGVTIVDNVQPMQIGRNMHMARLFDCTQFTVANNAIANGVGQFFRTDALDLSDNPAATPADLALQHVTPTAVGAVTAVSGLTSAPLVLTVPAGAEPGDVAVAIVASNGSPLPSYGGWLEVSSASSAPRQARVLTRELTSEDLAGGTLSFARGTGATVAVMAVWRGLRAPLPDGAWKSLHGAVPSIPVPTPTTTRPRTLIVHAVFNASGSSEFLTGHYQQEIVAQVAAGGYSTGCSACLVSTLYEGTGTGPARTVNTGSNMQGGAFTVALPSISTLQEENGTGGAVTAYILDMPELAEIRGGGSTRAEKRIRGSWPGVPREAAVLKIAGTYGTYPEPTVAQIASATEVYLGGHINGVTSDQKTALEAAGYTVSEVLT